MKNLEIARILYEIADMLELQGVEFKPRAYRRAARSVEELSEGIEEMYKKGGLKALREIPGVGEHISTKIEELIKTGKLRYYGKLKKEFPIDLEALGKVGGLGPKKAMKLYRELGVRNLADLEKAAKAHKIMGVEGFGAKSEEKMLSGLGPAKASGERMLLARSVPMVEELSAKLRALKELRRLEVVGSFRRRKETVGDVDLLAVSTQPEKIMDFFTSMYRDSSIISKGQKKSSIRLSSGLQVDLRVFSEGEFGSAMMYFTGSKEHNVELRRIAISKRMKLSEYGLFSGTKKVAGRTEEELYRRLGMDFIPPELRENMGEIEAAQEGKLPRLIVPGDVRGDLHCHSEWSGDASGSLEGLAKSAKSMGYEYLLISDHGGPEVRVVNGLDEKKLRRQMAEIDGLNKKLDGITLLKGVETNILKDGKIDLPNSMLKELDIVLASVHSNFSQPSATMTKRIISAMENEHVDIIAHPTGRLISSRQPIAMDFGEVADEAKGTGTFLEINCQPERMDLDFLHLISARGKARFTLGTDSHQPPQLRYMEFGISNARKGWCEKKDILNALALKDLRKIFGF
ncbi:MAG: DNA polymerase/3'-5' exonuclease PolX [Candidatus ainarchaeum sp.]|nr:DNA polymerase/3'-5' exonuclease PolX [Candidatus ainarchaeum sp.]